MICKFILGISLIFSSRAFAEDKISAALNPMKRHEKIVVLRKLGTQHGTPVYEPDFIHLPGNGSKKDSKDIYEIPVLIKEARLSRHAQYLSVSDTGIEIVYEWDNKPKVYEIARLSWSEISEGDFGRSEGPSKKTLNPEAFETFQNEKATSTNEQEVRAVFKMEEPKVSGRPIVPMFNKKSKMIFKLALPFGYKAVDSVTTGKWIFMLTESYQGLSAENSSQVWVFAAPDLNKVE